MIKVERLTGYDKEQVERLDVLMGQLSRKGREKISRQWIEDVTASPWHDELIAVDDAGRIVGAATMSIVMLPMRNIAYLEDFVVDAEARGGGIGGKLWDEVLEWSREKGAMRLEFSCGLGREAAHTFYMKRAEIYDTDHFRLEL